MAVVGRPFLKSLEGIRAYAFLMVFLVHFSGFKWNLMGRSGASYPWLILLQLSFVAVPIFFAMSGYLITGVLFDTLHRPGYFKVFYFRRAMRIFPLYYAILLFGLLVAAVQHYQLRPAHLLFAVYLNNWSPTDSLAIWGKHLHFSHLWSLAVEEQFYLLWPVVIWLLRGRRQLLTFCYVQVASAFALRLAFPLLHMTATQAYQSTFLRCDAIMLGAALALHERGPMGSLARLTRPAWVAVVGGLAAMTIRALLVGQALPYDAFGVAFIMPLLAVIGAGILILAMQPGNVVFYLSERAWAVTMGKLSYSLYILHELLVPTWEMKVIPMLSHHLGRGTGRLVGMLLAFALVYGASKLTYRFLEMPGLRMKNRFRYGQALWSPVPEMRTLALLKKLTI